MKTKIFTLLSLSLIALILFSSLVSALISFTSVPELSQSGNSVVLRIKSTESETATFSINPLTLTSGGRTITFTEPSPVLLTANNEVPVTVFYNVESGFKFDFGEDFSTALTALGSKSGTKTQTLSFATSDFCEVGNNGDLSVAIDDIAVTGFSEDDNEWYPTDTVKIDINVENNGNEDVKNIEVEWCLFDNENNKCVIDNTESDFNLNNGKDKTITITFNVDPEDLEPEVTDYSFLVKATGEIKGGSFDGEDSCSDDSENVEVILDSDFVVLNNIKFQETVQCGSEVVVNADVWNIGEDDQNDINDRVLIDEIKINNPVDVGDIDSFDKERLSTMITIPKDAAEKIYHLQFWVLDEDNDIYQNENDDESSYDVSLKVEGNCRKIPTQTLAEIIVDPATAIQSGGKAGESLEVKTKIVNAGDETQTFTISATGFDEWATSEGVNPSSLSLNAGLSQDVIFRFKVNKDVEGDQTFVVNVKSGTLPSATKTVNVPIEKASGGFKFPGLTGGAIINSDNWYLWGIGILNVILVIIIIIVAIRVARS